MSEEHSWKMDWEKLLSTKTVAEREKEPQDDGKQWDRYTRGEFEKDYSYIISSAVFRRLQDKTQVFPLEKNDFIRTRLTHSLEVSAIAKQLGVMVTLGQKNAHRFLPKDFRTDLSQNDFPNEKISQEKINALNQKNMRTVSDIPTVLACAGLLHDIGNPPFGHFGEQVIRDWFREELEKDSFAFENMPVRDILKNPENLPLYYDLLEFEGNAQTIRILSKAHSRPEGSNLNLTYSVINTLMKYTVDSEYIYNRKIKKDQATSKKEVDKKKCGYYQSEKNMINQICTETGTKKSDGSYCRHPLTFLLEAADDIAYATADLEDAVKKGLLTVRQFEDYFQSKIQEKDEDENIETEKMEKTKDALNNLISRTKNLEADSEAQTEAFQKWIIYIRNWLMFVVAYSFSVHYDEIMKGSYHEDLFQEGFHKYTVKILKDIALEHAYRSQGVLKLELSAEKIISSLMNDFVHAVINWNGKDDKGLTESEQKLLAIISPNYKADYQKYVKDNEPGKAEKLYARIMMATDFISGMTDSHARDLYRELAGID